MFSEEFYSKVELNLYNPAFCGLLLVVSIREYQEKNANGMHCTLPYLLLPMALNKALASNLPRSITTPIAGWIAGHEGEIIGLSESVTAFIEIVESGLAFLLSKNIIYLSEEGCFYILDDKLPKTSTLQKYNKSLTSIIKSASFLGRWFASSSSVSGVYAQLGMRP